MGALCFALRSLDYYAIVVVAPLHGRLDQAESRGGELVDRQLFGRSMAATVFRHARYRLVLRRFLSGWKINDRQQSARFERLEQTGIFFVHLGEVVIDSAHENGIAALARKVRFRYASFYYRDVLPYLPGSQRS